MCWTCASLAGAAPEVERVALGRYRWSAWRETLSLPTDAQALADRLAALRGEDVLKLELAGHVGMPGWELLQRAAGEAARRRARCSVISRACCWSRTRPISRSWAPAAAWPRSRRGCRRCRPRRATRRKPPLPPRRCGCCCGCSARQRPKEAPMKLSRIVLEEFRKFRQPLALDGLQRAEPVCRPQQRPARAPVAAAIRAALSSATAPRRSPIWRRAANPAHGPAWSWRSATRGVTTC